LRRSGDQTGGKTGDEQREAEDGNGGEDGRGGLRQGDLARRPYQRPEDGRTDADHDGEHHELDAGGDDVAEHALGQERRLSEQRERHQHEARQHRQLELDDGDEELDRQHEEGEQHDQPAQQQHGDGHKVGEERGDADELAGLLQERPRRRVSRRSDEPRPHRPPANVGFEHYGTHYRSGVK
jgi:hypothetical protein